MTHVSNDRQFEEAALPLVCIQSWLKYETPPKKSNTAYGYLFCSNEITRESSTFFLTSDLQPISRTINEWKLLFSNSMHQSHLGSGSQKTIITLLWIYNSISTYSLQNLKFFSFLPGGQCLDSGLLFFFGFRLGSVSRLPESSRCKTALAVTFWFSVSSELLPNNVQ